MMQSTVVGSFPVNLKKPATIKDKILNVFGAYDPYRQSIRQAVFNQLDAGVDIISDGQLRDDMLAGFSKFIPGMKLEEGNTVIVSKIRKPTSEITIPDLKLAKKFMNEYYNGNIPENKGVKGIITGPSTIVHSSRIDSFYKNKNDAIIDLAHSLKHEAKAIEDKISPVYIQIDEPFLSTGLVDMKVAREAIDIIHDELNVDLAMHVCGKLGDVYRDLARFNVDILDFEFAGNDVNIDILKNNSILFKNKKIGFGCLDTSKNEVDSPQKTENLISQAVNILGVDNILLDPDCGLRRASGNIAFEKLKLMNNIKDKYN